LVVLENAELIALGTPVGCHCHRTNFHPKVVPAKVFEFKFGFSQFSNKKS
jgi:hypothetical protein